MIQLIPFDPSKGGNIPDECLDNVRRGYGIQNKYDSAWEAWQHTQQHTDRPPLGLSIPVFYSYTTTINSVTQNYGHINVQLPDGTVWSDGNIYANIDAYMANHFPKFVGWGESVNDFKIIGGEPMSTWNSGDTYNFLASTIDVKTAEDAKAAGYFGGENGKDSKDALYTIMQSLQYGQMRQAAQPANTLPKGSYLVVDPANIKVVS